jgi:hypothetical protein
MKTLKKLFLLILFAFGTEVILAQTLTIEQNTKTSIKAKYISKNSSFDFSASILNNIVSSSLIVYYEKLKPYTIDIKYDTLIKGYKFAIHENVIDQATKIKLNFQQLIIDSLCIQFKRFGLNLITSNAKYTNILIQSIFLQNAVLNTAKRSYVNSNQCKCTPIPSYFVDKTDFWCQEDYLVKPASFINNINKSGYKISDKETEILNYLITVKDSNTISIDNVFNILIPKDNYMSNLAYQYNIESGKTLKYSTFTNSSNRHPCLLGLYGSDIGCCGNYSGCCYYASTFCFNHDIDCIRCDHWYCGWQCTSNM